MAPTEAERAGLIDRERLHALNGRGRKPQIALAARYGLKSYAQPAGGCCFLTDPAYSKKFKDAIAHRGDRPLTMEDVLVLGVGRHFRLSPEIRVVVGRDAAENDFLSRNAGGRWLAAAVEFTGPKAMVLGEVCDATWGEVASIVARYSDGKSEGSVEVEFTRGPDLRRVAAAPAGEDFIESHRI
jgi:hypothetical protein